MREPVTQPVRRQPIEMFGLRMHPWTMAETLDEIARRLDAGLFTQHVVVNVAKLVYAQDDQALRDAINGCELVNVDGMGVVWGGRLLGHPIPERVTGADLFDELLLLAAERGDAVFLLGARETVVEEVRAVLEERHPTLAIAGAHHGYFWDAEEPVVDAIRESGAKLLFVAVSSPRKEAFITRWRERLGVSFVMGVGGVFDIVAGVSRRAPPWMQRWGLEWLYRLGQEPRRMWKRYLVTNTRFAGLLLRARFLGR